MFFSEPGCAQIWIEVMDGGLYVLLQKQQLFMILKEPLKSNIFKVRALPSRFFVEKEKNQLFSLPCPEDL